jgi:hypothetical protein
MQRSRIFSILLPLGLDRPGCDGVTPCPTLVLGCPGPFGEGPLSRCSDKMMYVPYVALLFSLLNQRPEPAFQGNQDVEFGLVNESLYFKPKGLEQSRRFRLFREIIKSEWHTVF